MSRRASILVIFFSFLVIGTVAESFDDFIQQLCEALTNGAIFCERNCQDCVKNNGGWCNNADLTASELGVSYTLSGSLCWSGTLYGWTNTQGSVNGVDITVKCNSVPQYGQCSVPGWVPAVFSILLPILCCCGCCICGIVLCRRRHHHHHKHYNPIPQY